MKQHTHKALTKSLDIFKINRAKNNKLVLALYHSLFLIVFVLPPVINGIPVVIIKFWIVFILLDLGFRFNWRKLFFHKMSKRWLHIPHELVHLIPNLVFALLAFGVLDRHSLWIYITMGAIIVLYILMNFPLYKRLKERGDSYTLKWRKLYTWIVSLIIYVPIFVIAGYYALYNTYGINFFGTYLSNLVVAPTFILLAWLSQLRYYWITRKLIWVFVKDADKHKNTLLELWLVNNKLRKKCTSLCLYTYLFLNF